MGHSRLSPFLDNQRPNLFTIDWAVDYLVLHWRLASPRVFQPYQIKMGGGLPATARPLIPAAIH